MSEQNTLDEKLNVIAGVLIRCFLMAVICMIIWFIAVVTIPDWAYRIHSKFLPITREQFNFVHYTGLVMLKVELLVLFLLPYISIKWVKRSLVLERLKEKTDNTSAE